MTKQQWLAFAEVTDALRLVPRALMVGYCGFVLYLTDRLLTWYMSLPPAERGLEAAGLAGSMFTVVTGLATVFLNAYLNSGRKWDVQ